MSEMIERVARAMCFDNPDKLFRSIEWQSAGCATPTGPELPLWHSYVEQAARAIAAMREPTEAMLSEGNSQGLAACITESYHDDDAYASWQDGAFNIWCAMIDVALR